LVPDAILDRPKRGFKPPLEYWLRGELRPMLLDLLHSRGAQARDIIDLREIERLLTMHVQRTENHDLRLWAWLCFELWCRTYLDNPMAPLAPPERPSAGVAAITAL
jgi:asparagine synthase (glutamine-hydrolysing)